MRILLWGFGVGFLALVLGVGAIASWHFLTYDSDSFKSNTVACFIRRNEPTKPVDPEDVIESCGETIRFFLVDGLYLSFSPLSHFIKQPATDRAASIFEERGMAYFDLGEIEKANRDLNIAAFLSEKTARHLNKRVRRTAILPFRYELHKKAVSQFQKISPKTWYGTRFNDPADLLQWALILVDVDKRPQHIDTLAVTMANMGLFSEAAAEQKLAIERFRGQGGGHAELEAMRMRLGFFENGQPYRDCSRIKIWFAKMQIFGEGQRQSFFNAMDRASPIGCVSPG